MIKNKKCVFDLHDIDYGITLQTNFMIYRSTIYNCKRVLQVFMFSTSKLIQFGKHFNDMTNFDFLEADMKNLSLLASL